MRPLLVDCFGEQDAARIANNIIISLNEGNIQIDSYLPFSSPLYIKTFVVFLTDSSFPLTKIPLLMSLLSLFSSIMTTLALYIFLFRSTGSALVSIASVLLLQLNPTFWFNSLYGFPTIVALALFTMSLVLFQEYFLNFFKTYKLLLIFGALILYVASIMTKIDILLASSIFFLPLWRSKNTFKIKLFGCCLLLMIAGTTFYLVNKLALTMSVYEKSTEHWNHWSYKFVSDTVKMSLMNFFSKENINILSRAFGALTLPVALLAIITAGAKKNWRTYLYWIIAAALPLIVFWGILKGNSARHNLIPVVFVCILIALPFAFDKWQRWGCLVLFMCIGNYLWFPPSVSTVFPSGRLFASAILFKNKMRLYPKVGKYISHLSYPKIAIVGRGAEQPYLINQVLLSKHLSYNNFSGSKLEMMHGNQIKTFFWEI